VLARDQLPPSYCCHCLDCQTWSGSAFSQQVMFAEDELAVTGDITIYELTSPSGRTSRQRICPTCHTRIYNTNSARPGIAVLRAGTLDASDKLDAIAHIWTKRKQPWLAIPEGVRSWPETATAEFFTLLMPR